MCLRTFNSGFTLCRYGFCSVPTGGCRRNRAALPPLLADSSELIAIVCASALLIAVLRCADTFFASARPVGADETVASGRLLAAAES